MSKAFEKLFDGLITNSTHNGYMVKYPTTATLKQLGPGLAMARSCRRYPSARFDDGHVWVKLSEVHSERYLEETEEEQLDLGGL